MALTEKLKAIADAIRGKTGKTDGLTLDQMPTEIEGIESGGGYELKTNSTGTVYAEIPSVTVPYVGMGGSHVVFCEDCSPRGAEAFNTLGILEGYAPECVHINGHYPFTNQGNPLLKKIIAPKLKKAEGSYWGRNLKGLEFVQFGSIGHPVEELNGTLGFRDTTAKLTIEVYVDAETLADIPTTITDTAPWCATSATIIYRNSTTGEVITE